MPGLFHFDEVNAERDKMCTQGAGYSLVGAITMFGSTSAGNAGITAATLHYRFSRYIRLARSSRCGLSCLPNICGVDARSHPCCTHALHLRDPCNVLRQNCLLAVLMT
jgi:hypothetical protein